MSLEVARRLVALGVRHLGGLLWRDSARMSEVLFADEFPLSPSNLAPVPSFSFFPSDERLSQRWLVRRGRQRTNTRGEAMLDILMVPQGVSLGGRLIGRDIPAMAVETALELLPRG